jgi:protein tyrosine phosphatase (PTP) superfamily phosphohydrolase (DUF442 family)
MRPLESSLASIPAFRALGERLGTSGQPSADQFQAIRDAGFQVVINLALPTSDRALADEGNRVTGLGMAYVHLPVEFQAPHAEDFRRFCGVMEVFRGQRVFVHCAANMRVSAFLFLYRVLHEGVPVAEAETDLRAIWEPDEVWSRFLRDRQAEGGMK